MRIGAGRRGAMLHAHAQRLAEQLGADDQVGLAAGQVDQVGAQLAGEQVEDQRQPRADGQRPQRDEGLVRDDLVVDDRGHQARHHHEHVAQQRGQHGRAVVGDEALERAEQPVRIGLQQRGLVLGAGDRLGLGHLLRRHRQDEAAVFLVQFRGRGHAAGGLRAGEDDLVAHAAGGVVVQAPHQHAGIAAVEQQHRGQQQLVDLLDALAQQPGVVAGLAHQADGLVGADRALDRGAGAQRIGRARAPVVLRQPGQALQQRIDRRLLRQVREWVMRLVRHAGRALAVLGRQAQAGAAGALVTVEEGVVRPVHLSNLRHFKRDGRGPIARIRARCHARSPACRKVRSGGPPRAGSACRNGRGRD